MSLPAREPVATPEWPVVARYAAAVVLAVVALAIVIFVAPVASVIVAGALIAIVTGAAARWLVRRTRLGHVPAVVIVYALLLGLIVLVALTVFPWVVTALDVLVAGLRARNAPSSTLPAGIAVQKLELVFTTAQIQRLAEAVAGWVIRLLTFLLSSVGMAVYIIALGLFLSLLIHLDLGGRGPQILDRLPLGHRREVHLLRLKLVPLWTRFVGASLLFAVLVGLGSLVEFVILGVPYPGLMALLTALITPIPSIGGLLSSVIVAVPCLIFGSTRFPGMSPLAFAGMVWLINSIITQVAYNFVLMPVLGKAVNLPVSVVLVGVLASFAVNNIVFAFLVVPVLASLRILATYLYAKIQRREPFPDEPLAAPATVHPSSTFP